MFHFIHWNRTNAGQASAVMQYQNWFKESRFWSKRVLYYTRSPNSFSCFTGIRVHFQQLEANKLTRRERERLNCNEQFHIKHENLFFWHKYRVELVIVAIVDEDLKCVALINGYFSHVTQSIVIDPVLYDRFQEPQSRWNVNRPVAIAAFRHISNYSRRND